MLAQPIGTKRVHLLFLMRAIARLKPRTVLEVGSGNGLNLFILAARFPEIHFMGLELTAGGVVAANRVRAMAELPEILVTFAPEPPIDLKPFDRIVIVQGNAAALPFVDASFDLVITALALEQMEPIRHQALAEIRRVASTYTAMVEPFFDWNATGPQRDYIIANDYFSGSVAELERVGLAPFYMTGDMPSKLTIRPAFVVCRTR
jgi:ubiquinone/menaquinone biosynthesis C-methylase UbiE